jgi:hypothetical protein
MNATQEFLRQLSPKDFAVFGVDHVAYVKPVEVEGAPSFAIHAADGTQLAVLPARDIAFATIRQHDLEPVSVH